MKKTNTWRQTFLKDLEAQDLSLTRAEESGIHTTVWKDISYDTCVAIQQQTVIVNVKYRNDVKKYKTLYSETIVQHRFESVVSYETIFPQCERQLDTRFV